jgi:hypothetical protein
MSAQITPMVPKSPAFDKAVGQLGSRATRIVDDSGDGESR